MLFRNRSKAFLNSANALSSPISFRNVSGGRLIDLSLEVAVLSDDLCQPVQFNVRLDGLVALSGRRRSWSTALHRRPPPIWSARS